MLKKFTTHLKYYWNSNLSFNIILFYKTYLIQYDLLSRIIYLKGIKESNCL